MFAGGRFLVRQVLAVARVCCLFLFALFLPKFFMLKIHSTSRQVFPQKNSSFRLGLENLSDSFLKTLTPANNLLFNVGLVTNQTGRNQSGARTLDVLQRKGLSVTTIFAPEHGIDGTVAAGQKVQDSKDTKNNIPVVSLYGKGTTKRFDKATLENIDVLFFDMQDSGMRHYTYITIMFQMLEAATQHNKTVVVLDRPNLLGPYMEGPLVEPAVKSAISYASIPVRYGMTIGELALYYNKKILENPARLHVIPMKNYNRLSSGSSGLLAHLSPNIASMNSCYGYSFLGLLGEISPFDIGVGTSRAFQCILLPETIKFPKKKWHELHVELKKRGIENSFYRYYSARKKNYYSGLRLRVANINNFSSFSTLLTVVDFFKKSGVSLTFSKHFDKAAGTKQVREFLQGKHPRSSLVQHVNKGLEEFFKTASESDCFLYRPFPKLVCLS